MLAEWTKIRQILVDDKLTATELSDEKKILVHSYKTICDLNAELQIQREERVIADSMVTYLKQKLEDQESDISTLMETIDNIQNDLRKVSTDLDTKNVLLKTCAETIEILKNKNQKDKDKGNRDIISNGFSGEARQDCHCMGIVADESWFRSINSLESTFRAGNIIEYTRHDKN